jgi:hypothetical protein
MWPHSYRLTPMKCALCCLKCRLFLLV